MRLAAGELDRRIRLETSTVTQDTKTGAEVETPLNLGRVWAKARPIGGTSPGEAFEGGESVVAELDYRFVIRHRNDLTPKNLRVEFDGRMYDVQRVNELGRREGLELLAKARAE